MDFFNTIKGDRFINRCEQFFEDFRKNSRKGFDWKSFRAEAAKDAMCALASRVDIKDLTDGSIVSTGVRLADSLIAELQKKGDYNED